MYIEGLSTQKNTKSLQLAVNWKLSTGKDRERGKIRRKTDPASLTVSHRGQQG